MEIRVLNNWNEVMPYKNTWDDILTDIDNDIAFMVFEWLYIWWQYHGSRNKLFILMLTEGDGIVGFCPLMKVPKKGYEEIRLIGGDEASYMGLIVRKAYMAKAIEQVLDYLTGMDGRFLVNIHGIFDGSDCCTIIEKYLDNRKRSFFKTTLECFYTNMDGQDFGNYIRDRVGRGSIQTMKRKEKRIKKLGTLSYKTLDPKSDDIEKIFDIHDKRWQRKIGSSKFSEGVTKEFFKRLAFSEDLPFKTHIDTINIDDRIVSFIYGFVYNGRYIFYRISHDDIFGIFSPGEMVLRYKIKDCFEKGIKIFDFGVGYEPYKTIWGTHKINLINFIFPVNNLLSKLIYNVYRLKWNIRQSIKRNRIIYCFVKYKLGKIKYFLYPENANIVLRRLIHNINNSFWIALGLIYKKYDYYIMNKSISHLSHLRKGNESTCRAEEGSVESLEIVSDITNMKASDIIKRFLKGDRCVLINNNQNLYCVWYNLTNIEIEEIEYSYPMRKDSVFLYDYHTGRKKIGKDVLYCALKYLSRKGYKRCYLVVKAKERSFLDSLMNDGFNIFEHIKCAKWFNRLTCK